MKHLHLFNACRRTHAALRSLHSGAPYPVKGIIFRMACAVFALGMSGTIAGCAAWGQPDAATIVRDNKNAAVVCSSIVGPWGTSKLVVLNQDAGVIKDGGVSVDANCLVTTTSASPPRAPAK